MLKNLKAYMMMVCEAGIHLYLIVSVWNPKVESYASMMRKICVALLDLA